MASAVDACASVEIVHADAEALNSALIAATEGEEVLLASPNDISPQLLSLFILNKNVVTEPSIEQFSTIATGITDAFCAIASTGSVCVPVSKNLTVPISMLTRKHIVIVRRDTIVPKPRDVFSLKFMGSKGVRSSFSIITGPSATADMGPLVRGVHGPGKLHIIVLE